MSNHSFSDPFYEASPEELAKELRSRKRVKKCFIQSGTEAATSVVMLSIASTIIAGGVGLTFSNFFLALAVFSSLFGVFTGLTVSSAIKYARAERYLTNLESSRHGDPERNLIGTAATVRLAREAVQTASRLPQDRRVEFKPLWLTIREHLAILEEAYALPVKNEEVEAVIESSTKAVTTRIRAMSRAVEAERKFALAEANEKARNETEDRTRLLLAKASVMADMDNRDLLFANAYAAALSEAKNRVTRTLG